MSAWGARRFDDGVLITLGAIRAAPKVLLHDHLDGGVRVATIIELADRSGHVLPTTDEAALREWFVRGATSLDILQYLETFQHTAGVMQTADALERVAFEAVLDLASDGVVYAEVRFAPELHQERGLALDAVMDAVQAGFRRGESTATATGHPMTVNTIVCAMRTATRSVEVAELAVRWRDRDDHVVAFDIAGAETGWPPSLHADAFSLVRAAQMHITVHASEPPDLPLIADALVHGAERIGHGVRIMTDIDRTDPDDWKLGRLARAVLERQIHLEMAPSCHVHVGAVPSFERHPIAELLRHGFSVGVNTDNRLMSDVTVTGEVHAVAETFGLSWAEIGMLQRQAMEHSFADWSTRRRIVDDVLAPAYA